MKRYLFDGLFLVTFGVAAPLAATAFMYRQFPPDVRYGLMAATTVPVGALLVLLMQYLLLLRRVAQAKELSIVRRGDRPLIGVEIPETPDYVHGLQFWEAFFELMARHAYRDRVFGDERWRKWVTAAQVRSYGWDEDACCELAVERRTPSVVFPESGVTRKCKPTLPQLEQLGRQFAKAVARYDWRAAEDLYQRIQTVVRMENVNVVAEQLRKP